MNRMFLLIAVACTLVVLGISLVSYRMAPQVSEALFKKQEIVRQSDIKCQLVVKATVYKKPLFSWPPQIVSTLYENRLVLEDGRTQVFESIFIYEKGWTSCR